MYQVIARKYRPQTFSELVSQEHVKTTHRERHRAEPHRARLHLLGPARHRQDDRGPHPGALSELRGRAHGVRPAAPARAAWRSPTATRVDVIEIDAASNRGINEMRELRENVRYRPGARPLQSFHRRRSAPDHQRGFQCPAEDAGGASRVGRLHAVHHGGAQDSRRPSPRAASTSASARWISRTWWRAWSGFAARRASRRTPRSWRCWRKPAKAVSATRCPLWIRLSPAAGRS